MADNRFTIIFSKIFVVYGVSGLMPHSRTMTLQCKVWFGLRILVGSRVLNACRHHTFKIHDCMYSFIEIFVVITDSLTHWFDDVHLYVIWNSRLLDTHNFLGGSSTHFFRWIVVIRHIFSITFLYFNNCDDCNWTREFWSVILWSPDPAALWYEYSWIHYHKKW
jgi:hypothetical protein